jgi:alkanesulfonate monooxygenase SsuD/methylene tetrahydromethanopterin reductase-like flavin-dependent oxidoreductase (luciferase family)
MSKIVTVDGLEVALRPVSQTQIQRINATVETQWRKRGEPIDPPTYTITTATGETETHAHDADSVATGTDEERAAWEAYQTARAEMEAEQRLRTTKFLLLNGIVGHEPTEEWAEEQAYWGLEVPEDPRERRLAYLQAEVLKTPQDTIDAMGEIMRLSMAGAPQEVRDSVEAYFRRAVEGEAPAGGGAQSSGGQLEL